MSKIAIGALHEKIREELMRRVAETEYKPGERVPSAAALAQEFGVSAITVRRALRDLQSAGVLRTVPGAGTFVREMRRFIRDLDFSFPSRAKAQQRGLKSPIQLTSVTREKVRNPVLSEFDAPTGTMLCIRKIISIDGTPTMFDTSYLPLSLNHKVVDEVCNKFVSEALRDQGTCFRKTKLLIDAAPASEEAQQAFGIPSGYPTLRRLYQLTTEDPCFSLLGVTESPFDRLACAVELNI
ncbi:GntR family transcriptional regulator [Bradyrhizobium sp. BEA-2-5]|uniref:GntR family transcriptional regulator n=1 Tax=Bradyrhizobium sp. BEA-2-5 TaxID=3080015 RepID=UPI00293F0C26|nr:GntR family transcriptional regulator [Bradyrhizobium sp. BEA-2-5]WOH80335.1 GntR family transcriptional regulator [Bradyrhizobium sp. BEA-2-5]